MKFLLVVLCGLLPVFLFAQDEIVQTAGRLEKALKEKDSVALMSLLHTDLIYGHSNGWTESRSEMIRNIISGKIQYRNIISDEHECRQTGDLITIKMKSRIGFTVDNKEGELDLFVIQVWKKEGEEWKLLVRQSTRLN